MPQRWQCPTWPAAAAQPGTRLATQLGLAGRAGPKQLAPNKKAKRLSISPSQEATLEDNRRPKVDKRHSEKGLRLQLFSMLRKECEVAELGTSPLLIIAHTDPSGEMKHWYQRTKVASMPPLAKSISLTSSDTFSPAY